MIGESIGLTIPRNYFYIGQEHVFTAEAGLIYPVYSTILMPGDIVKVKNECVIRQMPTINPSFSRFKVRFWDFAVAIRNLDKNIYRFLSGFKEYTSEVAWTEPLKKWKPTDIQKTRPGTLWDFLENPINCIPEQKFQQIDYFRQAYGYIWDIYFRNETRQDSILKEGVPGSWEGEELLRVNYDRDYFTTSLPKQVLGTPMALPVNGITKAIHEGTLAEAGLAMTTGAMGSLAAKRIPNTDNTVAFGFATQTSASGLTQNALNKINTEFNNVLNENTVKIENMATVLLSQLTEMLAIESMHTINAIAGIRDDEFLSAHWGISPTNEALQYPVTFGNSEMSLITEAVFQTAPNNNSKEGVGDFYGKGTAVGESGIHTYHAKEFCIYMKLMYIKPETLYGSQGISREKCQNTMFDFPFIELNHLAMQPIYGAELLCVSSKKPKSTDNGITLTATEDDATAETYNNRILGFATNFSWYTEKRNKVSGLFNQEQYYDDKGVLKTKENLYNWTEARFFSIEDNKRPIINNDFLQCKIDNRNYQIVDDTIERCQFMVWHNNIVDSWRSMSSKRLPSMLGVMEGLK